jgi:hypothetical protein
MPGTEAVEIAAAKLRRAVVEGASQDVGRLAMAYRHEFERALEDLPGTDPETLGLVSQAKDLFEWARRTMLARRAHVAGRLRALPRPNPYTAPRGPIRHSWRMEA